MSKPASGKKATTEKVRLVSRPSMTGTALLLHTLSLSSQLTSVITVLISITAACHARGLQLAGLVETDLDSGHNGVPHGGSIAATGYEATTSYSLHVLHVPSPYGTSVSHIASGNRTHIVRASADRATAMCNVVVRDMPAADSTHADRTFR